MVFRGLFLISILFVGACTLQPKLDTSDTDKFEASLAAVRSKLNGEERDKFDQAYGKIIAGGAFKALGHMIGNAIAGDKDAGEKAMLEIVKPLDGMTAKDVIEYAENLDSAATAK